MIFSRNLTFIKNCRFCRGFSSANSSLDEVLIRNKLRHLVGDNGDVGLRKMNSNGHEIAVITLNHPTRKNAITGYMMVKLAEIVDELETWTEGKGLILHGEGETFCSGGDISTLKNTATPEEGNQMCFFMQKILTRLSRLPLISVAAVEGRALGGGAELATACDFILMSASSEIRFVQAKMGLSTGFGGGTRLVNLVGRRQALELLLKTTKLNADSALGCGLIDGKLPDEKNAVTGAVEWLLPYLDAPASIIQAIKKVAVAGTCYPVDESLTLERLAFASTWGAESHVNALEQMNKHK